ncbi:MAG: MarR family winged helix-turn-helix transcriptional regulator [Solirubrobacteraceae bacterium]
MRPKLDQQNVAAPESRPLEDSISDGLAAWMAELPGVDARIETARQRTVGFARLLERSLAAIATDHGLTLGDWEALSALQRSGPPYESSPKQLSKALGVTAGTMSARLERLTRAGLIRPGSAGADGRSRPVRLTGRGQQRWRAATAQRTAIEQRLFEQTLSGGDLDKLNHLLAKLLLRYEQTYGPPPAHGVLRADER